MTWRAGCWALVQALHCEPPGRWQSGEWRTSLEPPTPVEWEPLLNPALPTPA